MPGHSERNRRTVGTRRRIVASNKSKAGEGLALDDRPFALIPSRDKKWIFTLVPYGIRVLSADLGRVERSIDLPHAQPSVWEDEDHLLWVGGHHLYRVHAFSGKPNKVGTKLSGWVDKIVGLTRDNLLLGVGSQGEVLLERDSLKERFRRNASHAGPFDLTALDSDRAIVCHGKNVGHIIDLNHLDGYTQIHVKDQDTWENPEHTLQLSYHAEQTQPPRLCLATQDGAVAWTGTSLSLKSSLYLAKPGRHARPLAMYADARWLYVLREGAHLHRYLLTPPLLRKSPDPRGRGGARIAKDPLPKAQRTRLPKIASAMLGVTNPAEAASEEGPDTKLIIGCGTAAGHLGVVLSCDPRRLTWENLELGPRRFASPPEPSNPNFEPTRHRFSGPALREMLGVDEILSKGDGIWVTGSQTSAVVERSLKEINATDVMSMDNLVLAAMIRFSNGIVRPGWLYWSPGSAPESLRYFVWGDEPRTWTELATLELRQQKWTRPEVFPMQVALRSATLKSVLKLKEERYPKLSVRWLDPELFEAMAKECRQRLEVLW